MASTADLLFHATFKNSASPGIKQLTADLAKAKAAAAGMTTPTAAASREIDKLQRATTRSYNEISRFSREVTHLGNRLSLFVSLPLAVFFYKSAEAAADLVEQVNKTNVVFGAQAGIIHRNAQNAAKDFLLSKRAYEQYAGTFGAFLTPVGVTGQKRADMSTQLVELGADLASFYNTTTDDALHAIQSGLVGQVRPLRRYGVNLSAEQVNAEAKRNGSWDGTGDPSERAKILARYNIILAQSTLAQGDVARTANSAANQQKKLAAEFDNLKVEVGQQILPTFNRLLHRANDLIGAFNALPGWVQSTAVMFGVAALAAGPLISVLGRIAQLNAAITAGRAGSGLAGLWGRLGFGGRVATSGAAAPLAEGVAGPVLAGGAGSGLAAIPGVGWAIGGALAIGATAAFMQSREKAARAKSAQKWAAGQTLGLDMSSKDALQSSISAVKRMQDEQKTASDAQSGDFRLGSQLVAKEAKARYNALGDTLTGLQSQYSELIKAQEKEDNRLGYTAAIRARVDAYTDLTDKITGTQNALQGFNRILDAGQSADDLQWATREFKANQAKFGANWVNTYNGRQAQRELARMATQNALAQAGPNAGLESMASAGLASIQQQYATIGIKMDTSAIWAAVQELNGVVIEAKLELTPVMAGTEGEWGGDFLSDITRRIQLAKERKTVPDR